MKKHLIILLVAVLLICVGLSGCNEQETTTSLTDISYIMSHPNKYIDKTVTIRATIVGDSTESYYTILGSRNMYAKDSVNVVKPTPVVHMAIYDFTGIVRYGTIGVWSNTIYLEVTKIETT